MRINCLLLVIYIWLVASIGFIPFRFFFEREILSRAITAITKTAQVFCSQKWIQENENVNLTLSMTTTDEEIYESELFPKIFLKNNTIYAIKK